MKENGGELGRLTERTVLKEREEGRKKDQLGVAALAMQAAHPASRRGGVCGGGDPRSWT